MNLNRVLIVGRVTADIQLKSTPGGQSVCSFSVATNRTWNDKNGQKQEQTEFHNIVAWGRTAEVIAQYSCKGAELLVEGRLATREWTDKNNNKRRTTEIIAEHVQLGVKPQGTVAAAPRPAAKRPTGAPSLDEEEIPDLSTGADEIDPADIPF